MNPDDVGLAPADLERRVNRLANERTVLFEKASAPGGLSAQDQQRLAAVERELDECFLERRHQRATRDFRRFANHGSSSLPRRQPRAP
jgi:hypothetical protein